MLCETPGEKLLAYHSLHSQLDTLVDDRYIFLPSPTTLPAYTPTMFVPPMLTHTAFIPTNKTTIQIDST
jgi:hypothetical protein